MSDAAVEAARKFHEWMEERAYKWVSELVEKQVGEFVAIHTADLTARLASAEGKYEAQREQADFHAREALRFKAAVEQARATLEYYAQRDYHSDHEPDGQIQFVAQEALAALTAAAGGKG